MSEAEEGVGRRAAARQGAMRQLKRWMEAAFGVYVSRTPPAASTKHADAEIRRLRTWSAADVVFDVGANDGRTILRINELLNRPRFFAFEPVSSTYEVLLARTGHLPNVRAFQVALGPQPGRRQINVARIDAMSSFVPDWSDALAAVESVDVRTVDDLMAEQGIDFVHLLKVDTEGFDLEVLKGARHAMANSRIALVQVEVGVDQLPKALPSLEQARLLLAEAGYRLHGIYNQCRTGARPPSGWAAREAAACRFEVLAYCDALFVRADT